ncbi:LysR family transcriptional regulator [Micromonospora sp. NPDC049559]|uniref:LysR family transcriptional regulator n=1 Tax=Micromonospora sp. NPDC049559 TaxID=3155923 RepID=UPI00342D6CA8
MELRHLRYFVAVAEELHFGRAARRLHIAQPALSQQIQRLERELGARLLVRNRRQVQLSPAGAAFLPEARAALAQADRAASVARRTAAGELGRLALGFVGSVTDELLPRLLPEFRIRYPELRLELREMTSAEQVAALERGELDLGLLRPPARGLRTRLVHREPLVVALPAGHRLAGADGPGADELDGAELRGEPFVLFPRHKGPGLYDMIIDYCQRSGVTPTVVQEAVQMQTITALVAAGTGVALVPSSQRAVPRAGLVFRPLRSAPAVDLVAAWSDPHRTPAGDRALELLTEHFANNAG